MPAPTSHPEKNSLSIRLTEPVVALRSTSERAIRQETGSTPPPAIVRGLLTLQLAKPTKVSSIVLELQAKATTRYVQGAGRSRIDVTEQYKVHVASAVVYKTGPVLQVQQRATSARPRVQFLDDYNKADARPGERGQGRRQAPSDSIIASSLRSASLDPRQFSNPRIRRRSSSDRIAIKDGGEVHETAIEPAPPYTGPASHAAFLDVDSHLSTHGRSHSVASSSRLEELQNSPNQFQRNLTPEISCGSPSSSVHSIRDIALSRTSSIEELPEDDSDSSCFQNSSLRPDNVGYYGLTRITTGSSACSSEKDHRGRSRSRFSFGKVVHVLNAMKDRMRSRSPRAGSRLRSDEVEERGRSLMKGKGKARISAHVLRHALPQTGVAEPSEAKGANDDSGDGWVVFPGGTYTYPIFFTIPNNLSPTMKSEHGSLIWKVKAEVKRLGAFRSKMTAQKEVIVVCAPEDDGPEEAMEIDLQRQWDSQLQYRVRIARRGFPVGGKVPFQLTIIPLAKIKLHRISVYLDERTEYYTRDNTRARSDAIQRATLLTVADERYSEPILPLVSDDPQVFRKSPLHRFLRPDEDESEVVSSFMGPGPWTIRHQLRVPESCAILHPSNRIKGSNVMVSHTLKIVLRVEKEQSGVAAGRKKLYDIVIYTPIQILSCWCTLQWTSLPRYDEMLDSESDNLEDASMCPCQRRSPHVPKARTRSHAEDTRATTALAVMHADSLLGRNDLYERLMSGLVSETGEAPPSYETGAVYGCWFWSSLAFGSSFSVIF